jgi:hypothetical protein
MIFEGGTDLHFLSLYNGAIYGELCKLTELYVKIERLALVQGMSIDLPYRIAGWFAGV